MEYIIKRLLENKRNLHESQESSWIGGAPWDDDLFHENAERLGLEVKHEDITVGGKSLEFDYVILKSPTRFYHATTSGNVKSILAQGLHAQNQAKGQYVSGVFLTGSPDSLSQWRGKDTVVLSVLLDRGTKLYQDRQSNAVFVRDNVPSKSIEVYNN